MEGAALGAGNPEDSGNSEVKETTGSMVCQGQDRESHGAQVTVGVLSVEN